MNQTEEKVVTLRAAAEHSNYELYVPLFGSIGMIIAGLILGNIPVFLPGSNAAPKVVTYGAFALGIIGFIYWVSVQKPRVEWNSKNGRIVFYPDHFVQVINQKEITENYDNIKEIRIMKATQQTRGTGLTAVTTNHFVSIIDQSGKIITTFNTKTYDRVLEYLESSPLQNILVYR